MIRLLAPAKLTRSLRVTGRRPDGLHTIEAEMVSLDLADLLELEEAPTTEISVLGEAARGVVGGRRNLVVRALEAAGRRARVVLHKSIPAGGGLGGGSSDAAAVLRWAGVTDPAVALGIGSDVPFCVAGGRARVTGVGLTVEPLPFEPATFTLLMPGLHSPTPAVYGAWDDLGGPRADGPNDLEEPAMVVEGALRVWRDRFGEATGLTPVLAGSGSTWYVEGEFPDLQFPGARVVVARTVPSGWEG